MAGPMFRLRISDWYDGAAVKARGFCARWRVAASVRLTHFWVGCLRMTVVMRCRFAPHLPAGIFSPF
jgi:hypothetical protein